MKKFDYCIVYLRQKITTIKEGLSTTFFEGPSRILSSHDDRIYFMSSSPVWQLCTAMMSWVGCLLPDSELFILFAGNSQILLKVSVIFIYLIASIC